MKEIRKTRKTKKDDPLEDAYYPVCTLTMNSEVVIQEQEIQRRLILANNDTGLDPGSEV